MKFKISYVKDSIGNNYLGIKIPKYLIEKYLEDLKYYIEDDEKYDLLISNQQKRDANNYHITVVSAMELDSLFKKYGSGFHEKTNAILSFDIDLQMLGIGEAKSYDKEAYFIVTKSHTLSEIRKTLQFPDKDFHITLGFNPKDVFDKPKNQVIKLKTPLQKEVDKQLKNTDGKYTFVFDIKNFDDTYNDERNLEFVSLTDNILTIKVRNTTFQIGMINDVLHVLTQSSK